MTKDVITLRQGLVEAALVYARVADAFEAMPLDTARDTVLKEWDQFNTVETRLRRAAKRYRRALRTQCVVRRETAAPSPLP